jgi:pyruvate/2-oxoglutarate dehydrogenase complex dihydrolipoamide acyltransferase (E2) component
MKIEILIEDAGDAGDAGEIEVVELFVSAGDTVAENQPLAEVATDKANMEIAASQAGVISEILVTSGQIIDGDQVLMILETE